jgi:hypothetical protein
MDTTKTWEKSILATEADEPLDRLGLAVCLPFRCAWEVLAEDEL